MPVRYDRAELQLFAQTLLAKAGLNRAMARTVAEVLIEGDLLSKSTHGLALLPAYLQNLAKRKMTRTGRPKILKQSATTQLVDAHYLPGPVVVRRAIDWAVPRAKKHGVATVSIRRCHHIACLQAYLQTVTDEGLVILLICSDPANAVVAPTGGVQGVFSPNPIAAGFPTEGAPILIDTTTSSASNASIARKFRAKVRLPFPVLQTPAGQATDDPEVMFKNPPGSILPLGGLELGHKGFALSTIVEALTNALCGHGRAQKPGRWGASVYLQVIDPSFFGGRKAFVAETQFFSKQCWKTQPAPGTPKVRLPGEQAQAYRYIQLKYGMELHPEVLPALRPWIEKLGVTPPNPLKLQ
jgi:L-lactate dehydrogenase